MRAVDIIRKKRDGEVLDRADIDDFVAGATEGSWPDYQLSALLMAIVLKGMGDEETAWLTEAMARSGARLDLQGLPGRKVDKHSTGGVGDKTSLVLAPLAAACGAAVPMMSGRRRPAGRCQGGQHERRLIADPARAVLVDFPARQTLQVEAGAGAGHRLGQPGRL
ncbi:MAG: hypothetical protein R6V57_16805, partial [Vicinamibacterales bacterium]